MNKLLTFVFTITVCLTINAQTEKVGLLIEKLNNNQLYGTCNYVWVLKMESEEADSLVNIGKSISHKLIPILESPEKGIIAHCVLSRIWVDDFSISTSFENFDKKGIVEYKYNGLPFYEKDKKMIAEEKVLSENKKSWIEKVGL